VLGTMTLSLAGCSTAGTSTQSAVAATTTTTTAVTIANLQPYADATGTFATYAEAGLIYESTPFFQPLGTNGRSCGTCHQPSLGMSIIPAAIQALFAATTGTDPLFAAVDGANCATATTGNTAQHSLLLNKGLIRVAITLPATAQFKLAVLTDPYGCAVTTDASGQQIVSVYRRPLPTSNLSYLTTVMWDTRETIDPLSTAATFNANLTADLTQQMTDAISTHAQGTTAPTATQIAEILSLEQGLYTAQATDSLAGSLAANGALGGSTNLAAQKYYPGINDSQGNDPTGAIFNPNSMTIFGAWQASANAQQASIARGEAIFNTGKLNITDVAGLTGPVAPASCSFCHDTPNIGNRSVAAPLDTGTAHNAAAEADPNVIAGLSHLSLPSPPVYQITGRHDPVTGLPVTYTTSDPGKALFSGLCSDMNRTKIPTLRDLAARAPYFHGGAAANLQQVVAFYNARFQMNLNPQRQADLVNFLNAL
jgi:cytochrome c peroxidase